MNAILLIGTAASLLLAGAFALVAVVCASELIHDWRPPAFIAGVWGVLGSTGLVFIARAMS